MNRETGNISKLGFVILNHYCLFVLIIVYLKRFGGGGGSLMY